MPIRQSPFARKVLIIALGLVIAGCGESFKTYSVDTSKAKEALTTTLDAWKKGSDLASLKSGSPSITAQDLDWITGATLVDYKLLDEGQSVDSNFRVAVRLVMKTKDGKDATKDVHYLVSTSPAVTVFRDVR